MKSEITKRWYLILLSSTLGIKTFLNLHEVFWHSEPRYPIVLFSFLAIELMLDVFVWYALIKQDSTLKIAVIIWAGFNLFLTIGADIFHFLRGVHPLRSFYTAHSMGLLLTAVLVFIKNIRVNKEAGQPSSDETGLHVGNEPAN